MITIYKKISNRLFRVGCGCAAAMVGLFMAASCSDTWDDHYNSTATIVQEGTLWQAIKSNSNLSNFASVLEACGFDKSLNSNQVFTVFAPTNDNLSAEEAADLIAKYNEEKKEVSDEDNTVIKEFVHNHIALYNFSVAPTTQDTLTMMNGKYVALSSGKVGNATFDAANGNNLYENGLLFIINDKVEFEPNIFEYLRKDSELDSVASFLYDSRFYRKVFEPSLSVAGGLENGKTVYLDSVFSQINELFGSSFLYANLSREDSTFWMVTPTNNLWTQLVNDYSPYFQYDDKVEKRDSVTYTNTRLAIMQGTIFSRTFNSDAALQDSAFSTLAVRSSWRSSYWGTNYLHYYQYGDAYGSNYKPLQAGGLLNGTRNVECSNGTVMKTDQWNINPLQTFNKMIIVSATGRGNLKEIDKVFEPKSKEWVNGCETTTKNIVSGTRYYNQLINGNSVLEIIPEDTIGVTYNIKNVLSNMGYDIYVVTVPALAVDSSATVEQRLPTRIGVRLFYHNKDGEKDSTSLGNLFETTPDVINYIKVAEDFKFNYGSYNLNETNPQITMRILSTVTNRQINRDTHTRTMYLSSILLIPHGSCWEDENNLYFMPHGDGVDYHLSKCIITNPQEEEQ